MRKRCDKEKNLTGKGGNKEQGRAGRSGFPWIQRVPFFKFLW
jgi:hypothetical protein